jgi:hypothetical protein
MKSNMISLVRERNTLGRQESMAKYFPMAGQRGHSTMLSLHGKCFQEAIVLEAWVDMSRT